jgi:hypothetical protein
MKGLTREEMEELFEAHGRAEFELSTEATMATVGENPRWEIPGLGLAVIGRDAVAEMYRRTLPCFPPRKHEVKNRTFVVGENVIVYESYAIFDTHQGERVTGSYVLIMEFDPETKKIISERVYGDTVLANMQAEDLGEGFDSYPGVVPLADVAP